MVLDIYSLLVANMVVNLIALSAFAIIYIENRKRYNGLEFFVINLVLQVIGIFCIVFRPVTGNIVSLVVGNSLLLASCIALITGLQIYRQLHPRYKMNVSILLIFVITSIWFTQIVFNAATREIILACCIIFYEIQLILLLIKSSKNDVLPGKYFLLIAFAGYIITSLIRIISNIFFLRALISSAANSLIDAITVISYSALSILVAVGLILLITRRLVYDVQRQEIIYKMAFHSAPYGLLMAEYSTGKIITVNEGFEKITGYSNVECHGQTTQDIKLWNNPHAGESMLELMNSNETISGLEVVLRKKDGSQATGLLSSEITNLPEGKMMVSNIADVTELVEVKKELKEKATHDFLTGLPNRFLFYDRFAVAKAYADRNARRIGIMSLDLDHFKEVNDSFGHDVGDMVLVEMSMRFLKCIRKTDTIARFGGDEFVIMIQDVHEDEGAIKVASELIRTAQEPIVRNDNIYTVGVSIGISFYPENGSDLNMLLKKSDAALYESKGSGRNTWKIKLDP